jgi:hypothetical protein
MERPRLGRRMSFADMGGPTGAGSIGGPFTNYPWVDEGVSGDVWDVEFTWYEHMLVSSGGLFR